MTLRKIFSHSGKLGVLAQSILFFSFTASGATDSIFFSGNKQALVKVQAGANGVKDQDAADIFALLPSLGETSPSGEQRFFRSVWQDLHVSCVQSPSLQTQCSLIFRPSKRSGVNSDYAKASFEAFGNEADLLLESWVLPQGGSIYWVSSDKKLSILAEEGHLRVLYSKKGLVNP